MNNKVQTTDEAVKLLNQIGVKNVSSNCQKRNGTVVLQLPFKRMCPNGKMYNVKLASYQSGYVRNISGFLFGPYQINRRTAVVGLPNTSIMIPDEGDRLVYLTNHIFKNYIRNANAVLVGCKGAVAGKLNKTTW